MLLAAVLYWGLLATFFRLDLPGLRENEASDVLLYRSVGEGILRGELPYRDFFLEYPPGSLPAFVPPAFFSSTEKGYAIAFAHEMILALVATLVVMAVTARRLGGYRAWLLAAPVFVVGVLLVSPVATSRYDPVVSLSLALGALGAALGGRFLMLGYASLGFGAAAKLIPALAVLPMVLFGGREQLLQRLRSAVQGLVIFSATLALPFVTAYLLSGWAFFQSFTFHAKRGLQIESLASSVLMKLGLLEDVAYEVEGPAAELLSSLSLPITATLLLVSTVVMYREWRLGRAGPGRFPRYAAALILAFMLGSKVLSPQFMLWLLPLIPLAASGWWSVGVSAVFLVASWLTTQVYPFHYRELASLDPAAVNMLLARNLLLVMLWALMLFLPAKVSPDKERS